MRSSTGTLEIEMDARPDRRRSDREGNTVLFRLVFRGLSGTGVRWLRFAPVRRLPVARELGETSLMFLVHPTLTPRHMDETCSVVRDVIDEAT